MLVAAGVFVAAGGSVGAGVLVETWVGLGAAISVGAAAGAVRLGTAVGRAGCGLHAAPSRIRLKIKPAQRSRMRRDWASFFMGVTFYSMECGAGSG